MPPISGISTRSSVMAMPIDDLLLLHAQAARLGVRAG